MESAICTLYEGHYHHGVAALSNSLYKSGFRGSVYIGYRGMLPSWAKGARDNSLLNWEGGKTLSVAVGLDLQFLPLTTNYHLTNYKPDFMLQLWEGPAKNVDSMFYFDPDIVLVAPFSYLEEWIDCGVALCEDVNSPLQEFHPRRVGWRKYYRTYNIDLHFKNQIYVNGGFVGLLKKDIVFLHTWKKLQELMGEGIGGLSRSIFKNSDQLLEKTSGDYAIFGKTDQDALNSAIESYTGDFSFMGKDAMDFANGVLLLPHALGVDKPWLINPIKNWVKGKIPRRVDKEFWRVVENPVSSFSRAKIYKMKFSLKVAAFLGRFYRK
jgi:hypothetical protein